MALSEDKIDLHDNTEMFLRAKGQNLLFHNRVLKRRLSADDVTNVERNHIVELIADNERQSQYWIEKANTYVARF